MMQNPFIVHSHTALPGVPLLRRQSGEPLLILLMASGAGAVGLKTLGTAVFGGMIAVELSLSITGILCSGKGM